MAKQRDVDRWKKGKDHWNRWAEGRLKAKEKLEKEGKWAVGDFEDPKNTVTKRWQASASADFTDCEFEYDETSFSEFIFPFAADFERVEFKGSSDFDGAKFLGPAFFFDSAFLKEARFYYCLFSAYARFSGTIFSGSVGFGSTEFSRGPDFSDAKFLGNAFFDETNFSGITIFDNSQFSEIAYFEIAVFSGSTSFFGAEFASTTGFEEVLFEGPVDFSEARFVGATSFQESTFNELASFKSATSKGQFSLAGTTFRLVPDFIQMNFRAPARLDDLHVVQATPFQREGDKERAACYRALKKIAIEAHDHVREQNFFASEARERRGNDDPKWSPAWLFSFPYEFFSDFGWSIAAPFFWWTVSTFAFWLVYLAQRDFAANLKCKIDPAWESLYLSLKSAFLVIGWESSQKLSHVYSCLYGGTIERPELPAAIPFLQTGQTLWSAILIFLFLLALRNHFRIK